MTRDAPRLGRGLNTLVGRTNVAPLPSDTPGDSDGQSLRQISIDAITPNPRQPRSSFDDGTLEELSRSIRANGLLQPVIVRPAGDLGFELVAGERRLRAAKLASMTVIPAIVRSLSDAESLEIAMLENLQREDLSPLERAACFQRYIEMFDVSIEELAKRLSQSRANISNYLRLLKLRPEIHVLIGSGQLGMGQARAVAGIEDPHRQLAIARLAARRNLSVRQVEALAQSPAGSTKSETGPAITIDRHYSDVAHSLSRVLGLNVSLRRGRKKNSGRVIIQYNDLDEFDRIAERIGGRPSLE